MGPRWVPPSTLLRSRRNPNQSHSLFAEPPLPAPARCGSQVEWVRNRSPRPSYLCKKYSTGTRSTGLAGKAVRTLAPHTEAQPEAILLQLLAAFGNVIGPRTSLHGRGHPSHLESLRRAGRRIQQGSQGDQLEPDFPTLRRSGSHLDGESCHQRASYRARPQRRSWARTGSRSPSSGARRGARLRAAHHGPQQVAALAPAALRLGQRYTAHARP